jgi:hypothetical protein
MVTPSFPLNFIVTSVCKDSNEKGKPHPPERGGSVGKPIQLRLYPYRQAKADPAVKDAWVFAPLGISA